MDHRKIASTILVASVLSVYYVFVCMRYRFLTHTGASLRNPAPITDENNDFMYFVHITDTHITHKENKLNDRGLSELVSEMDKLQPAFVVHTGDITDGVSPNGYTIDENDFKAYARFREQLKCPVYDVRGNHDTFGAGEERNEEILEKYFGTKRNFYEILETPNFRYLCLFVDATPKIGSKRMFNFFGHFEDEAFAAEVKALKSTQEFDQVLMFVHYPSNTLCTQDQDTLQSSVHISGHLHNAFLFTDIWRLHGGGCLETVLQDFKRSGKFRICTLDHGNFSFNDFTLDEKPRVVIMSPPVANTKSRAHPFVRFLAFSYAGVVVEVDGKVLEDVTSDGVFHSARLPGKYKQITVKGTNKHGTTVHTVSTRGNPWGSVPIRISFKHFAAALLLSYVIIFYVHASRIPAYIPATRIFLLTVFPNAILRPFNESFELLYSFKVGSVDTYDAVVFFSLSVFLIESFFVLALSNRRFVVPYNIASLLLAAGLHIHFGFSLRLEDIFLLAADCYFIVEMYKRGRVLVPTAEK